MPKAGRYDFPAITLDDAIEKLRRIRENSKERAMSREIAAQAMGMSERGGHTANVISAMADYGLIETGEREIRITQLGDTIIYGDTSDIAKAKHEAVMHVELFRNIFNKFDQNPTEDQIKIFLRQNAAAELPQIPSLAGYLGKLLKRNAPYVRTVEPLEISVSDSGRGTDTVSIDRSEVKPMSEKTDTFVELRIEKSYARFPRDNLDEGTTLANAITSMVTSLQALQKKITTSAANQLSGEEPEAK